MAIAIDADAHKTLQSVPVIPSPWKPILDITGNLLTVDDVGIVTFSHYSAKEYLLRTDAEQPDNMADSDWAVVQRYLLQQNEAHEELFAVCLTYLGFPEFEKYLNYEEGGGSTNGIDAWARQNPFVSYAARWWNYHMEELSKATTELQPTVVKKMEALLIPGSKKLHVLMNTYLNMRAKASNMGWTLHSGAMSV